MKNRYFKIIDDNIENGDFAGNINDESITEAQRILNVKFPESYIQFLKKYGCGDIFGTEIYGIVSSNNIEGTGIPSLVWLTKELRKDGLLPQYIPICFADDGCYYILDTNQINENECPVLIWDSGNLLTEKNSRDFEEFMVSILSED